MDVACLQSTNQEMSVEPSPQNNALREMSPGEEKDLKELATSVLHSLPPSDADKLNSQAKNYWVEKYEPVREEIRLLYSDKILPVLTKCSKAGEWTHEMSFHSYESETEAQMFYEQLCQECRKRGLDARIVRLRKFSWISLLTCFTYRTTTIDFSWIQIDL